MSKDDPPEQFKAANRETVSQATTTDSERLSGDAEQCGQNGIGKPQQSEVKSDSAPENRPTTDLPTNGSQSDHGIGQPDIGEASNRLSTLQIRGPAISTKTDEHLDGGGTHKVSEWSHQALAPLKEDEADEREEEWQEMPAVAEYDLYDDDGKLVARKVKQEDIEGNAYTGLGGAGKGYTRVQHDEDADSTSSMEDNTSYLFKQQHGTEGSEDDEEMRDTMAQMQATKDLLTEGQRIAYVGVTRVTMAEMIAEVEKLETTKGTKKEQTLIVEAYQMWSQKMMVRLYAHMEISSSGM